VGYGWYVIEGPADFLLPGWMARGLRRRRASKMTGGLVGLARVIAGRRHAHLRDPWAADQYGDPKTGQLPSVSRGLRLAGGDVVAAVRCRIDDASLLAWRPVDALLASWHASRIAVLVPVIAATWTVLLQEGFYGLVDHWDSLGGIATASYLAIKGLRRYRQISTPKRPEKKKKASPEDGGEQ
jgi:hypothetical protein